MLLISFFGNSGVISECRLAFYLPSFVDLEMLPFKVVTKFSAYVQSSLFFKVFASTDGSKFNRIKEAIDNNTTEILIFLICIYLWEFFTALNISFHLVLPQFHSLIFMCIFEFLNIDFSHIMRTNVAHLKHKSLRPLNNHFLLIFYRFSFFFS